MNNLEGGPDGDYNTLRDEKVAKNKADGGERVRKAKPIKSKRLQKGYLFTYLLLFVNYQDRLLRKKGP